MFQIDTDRARVLDRFGAWRGTVVSEPETPEATRMYHHRRLPLIRAATEVEEVVARIGREAALPHYNDLLLPQLLMPFFFIEDRYAPQFGRTVKRGTFFLPGGCHWAVKGGPCNFCIFQPAVEEIVGDLPLNAEEFTAIAKIGMTLLADCEVICCFTAGSLLNPGEIPTESKIEIARTAAGIPALRTLLFESRVQFFDSEEVANATLAPIVEILAATGRTCELAIGVESMDEDERRKLRKGMTTKRLLRALEWGNRVGARISTYVILMPLPVDELSAMNNCEWSVRELVRLGSHEVLVQPRYGPVGTACPTHWAIAETIYALRDLKDRFTLGYWANEPGAEVVPSNKCPHGSACDEAMLGIEDAWRRTQNFELFRPDNLRTVCTCYADWKREIGAP